MTRYSKWKVGLKEGMEVFQFAFPEVAVEPASLVIRDTNSESADVYIVFT
jgi:hypothetical protein